VKRLRKVLILAAFVIYAGIYGFGERLFELGKDEVADLIFWPGVGAVFSEKEVTAISTLKSRLGLRG
jgi:hypothetical protein